MNKDKAASWLVLAAAMALTACKEPTAPPKAEPSRESAFVTRPPDAIDPKAVQRPPEIVDRGMVQAPPAVDAPPAGSGSVPQR